MLQLNFGPAAFLPTPPPTPAANFSPPTSKALLAPHLSTFVATLLSSIIHRVPLPVAKTWGATVQLSRFTHTLLNATELPLAVVLVALKLVHRLVVQCRYDGLRRFGLTSVLVCALSLSSKFLLDNSFTAKTWAGVAGIAVQEINAVETLIASRFLPLPVQVDILVHLDFDIFVSESEYFSWLQCIESAILEFNAPSPSPPLPSSFHTSTLPSLPSPLLAQKYHPHAHVPPPPPPVLLFPYTSAPAVAAHHDPAHHDPHLGSGWYGIVSDAMKGGLHYFVV
ncbi:hypothetical protein BDK51DRAFT_46635 [Blyttiomyces helicus]|uniref:Cyclin N-terminal domain-containing protein n=1 Tax=Blyttiomyces helicus TaxID=388810 RepID=A0A4P9WGC6_9FUNG|nr:hypothetical protein BDK51DRAFT_46635 [Blyttiomyces helicus]|eukprot:RKO90408.1 hypothetical protein BDK51DRAFT_46635 [Blyttiomyces helicus]